jgi:antibiotic biosynthesis monooxygenase (ABM) superfamily enzyme
MPLAKHIFVTTASVDPSIEDEWNRWYDEIHVPAALASPGIRSAQRYVATRADGIRRYVAIYEFDGPEALETPEAKANRNWGPFTGDAKVQGQGYFYTSVS